MIQAGEGGWCLASEPYKLYTHTVQSQPFEYGLKTMRTFSFITTNFYSDCNFSF